MALNEDNFKKFKKALQEMLMLDQADLDFGIYRIMNQKRADIENYINNDLRRQVTKAIAEHSSVASGDLQKQLQDVINQCNGLGVDPNTNPKVLELKAKIAASGNSEDLEAEVYNQLSIFFSRYYDGGDFISQRRYKKNVYAIPYEGEEVKLHWANADQYYIKTGEYFRNYRFALGGDKFCEFTLVDAETEQNNNKTQGDKVRCFALYHDEPIRIEGDTLHINFTYELMPKGTKQTELIARAFEVVKPLLPADYGVELLVNKPTEKDPSRTLLQKHMNDYVARNTFDYFIHKDLKGFLSRELDFFIKNEILEIDDIDAKSPNAFLNHLTVIKAIKVVGKQIITFLAQLENFQKKLWLKKKFVVQADYCITLDRVPETLYEEIASNDAQREEWVRLFAIDEIKADLAHQQAYSAPLTVAFLKENPFLVLDTAFFSADFKRNLLAAIDNIDEQCNGLLVNSENFQALELLQEKYKEQVKCVYIDPPYNTGGDDFVYKDNYQESSWLSLLSDRLSLTKPFFQEGGSIAVSIDIKELDKLIGLLDANLGSENRKANITVRRASITGAKVINPGLVNISENVIIYSNNQGTWIPQDAYREKGYDNRYNVLITNIDQNPNDWEFSTVLEGFATKHKVEKKKLKKVFEDKYDDELYKYVIENASSICQFASLDLNSVGNEARETYKQSVANPDTVYHIQREQGLNDYYIKRGKVILFYKDRLKRIGDKLVPVEKVSDIWDDVLPNDIHNEGGVVLKKGKKPEKLIDRIFESTTLSNDLVLDYFAGSGTSSAVALKMGRRFINVELGEYFDSKTLLRMKNTLYGDKSGVTDKYSWKGGGMVKYMRLEQYEDTLNNLIPKQDGLWTQTNEQFYGSYMLGYMLDVETRDSLFNLQWFRNPWNTKMKITRQNATTEQNIDLVETFNYLIGLYVETMTYPRKNICVVTGRTRTGEKSLIIWRNVDEVNNEELDKFFEKMDFRTKDSEFDRIYVNGDNNLENLRTETESWKVVLAEEEFAKRMFEDC